MSNQITKQILEEMIELSVAVIRHVEKSTAHPAIQNQIVRSVTSIGANYSEAQDASSKRDFVNKIYIAKKEASETVYWLKLLQKLGDTSEDLILFQDKSQRFVMLLQKIITSTRDKSLQAKG